MLTKLTILETNFDVEFDYTITSHGFAGSAPSFSSPGEPPEACEWELEVLAVYDPKDYAYPVIAHDR